MPAPARHRHSYEEYLALDEQSNVKLEYLDGEIFAMAGGTPDHAALAMVIGSLLVPQLRPRGCRVFSSDLRVRVKETGLTTYPDVTVVCGLLERDPQSPTTVVNPTVLIEVTSDSTEHYDRDEKAEHYRQVPSLRACLLASHRRPHLDVWLRDDANAWVHREFGPGEILELDEIGARLAVDEIYQDGLSDFMGN